MISGLLILAGVYCLFLAGLLIAGRRGDAAAAARFVPDCARMMARCARDPRLGRVRRWALYALVVYLASPIDLVPDFLPVVGQLDDAILVLLALRGLPRDLVVEHWPGPQRSLRVLLRSAR